MVTCEKLCQSLDCTIIGPANVEVTSLVYRSDEATPGSMFFCIVGTAVDGHNFAQDAVNRGAKFLVVERKLDLANGEDVTFVVVPNTRIAMATIAAEFYGNPSGSFNLVGVTGTNGKTTTTYLVNQIAKAAGLTTGLIGTVGISIAGNEQPASHTTPESLDLQRIFAEMEKAGCQEVVMEVSSHALDLYRVWDTKFAVTVFTNLTQDHLDYHHTLESYFEAKAKLFTADYPARRVIAIDDPWGAKLANRCATAGDSLITFGFAEAASIHPTAIEYFTTHTAITLDVMGEAVSFDYPLVGAFNVQNIMAAFAVGLSLEIEVGAIIAALECSPQVPGRLERVALNGEAAPTGHPAVFVDYAHTPDALEKALACVQSLTDGRTIVVFGCGGDRDATKRPIMGKAALAADFAIVTSDNPRSEDPAAIIEDILQSMNDSAYVGRYAVQPDRALAIDEAMAMAQPQDSVLIAGKGHENYQILGATTIHFDDREVAAAALAKYFGSKA